VVISAPLEGVGGHVEDDGDRRCRSSGGYRRRGTADRDDYGDIPIWLSRWRAEKSDHRHRGLLRVRRDRPRSRTTNYGQELPPPHFDPSMDGKASKIAALRGGRWAMLRRNGRTSARAALGSSAGVGRPAGSRVKCLTKQTEWLQRSERVKCATLRHALLVKQPRACPQSGHVDTTLWCWDACRSLVKIVAEQLPAFTIRSKTARAARRVSSKGIRNLARVFRRMTA
jgi:hypothetical protein